MSGTHAPTAQELPVDATRDKILRNTLFNLIASTVGAGSRLVVAVVVARVLGPVNLGLFSLSMFVVATLDTLTSFGLQATAIKFVSELAGQGLREDTERVYAWIVRLKIVLTSAATVVLLLAAGPLARFYETPALEGMLQLASVMFLPSGLAAIFSSVTQGLQDYRALSVRAVWSGPLQLVLTIAALWLGFGVPGLIVAAAITQSAESLYYLVVIDRHLSLKLLPALKLPANVAERVIRYNWQIGFVLILDTIVWQKSGVFFLGKLSTHAEVGFYSAAHNLATWTLAFLPGVFTAVLLPALSELHGLREADSLRRVYVASTRYVLMATAPLCLYIVVMAPALVLVLFGETFLPMAPILQVLAVSTCAGIAASPGSSVINAMDRQRFILKVGCVFAVVTVVLDVLLIPPFGALGAAVANATSQIISVVLGFIMVGRLISVAFPRRDGLAILGGAAAVAAACLGVNALLSGWSAIVCAGVAAVVVYPYVLARCGGLRPADIDTVDRLKGRLPGVLVPPAGWVLGVMRRALGL